MGNPSCQTTHRFNFLGMGKLFLDCFKLGNIPAAAHKSPYTIFYILILSFPILSFPILSFLILCIYNRYLYHMQPLYPFLPCHSIFFDQRNPCLKDFFIFPVVNSRLIIKKQFIVFYNWKFVLGLFYKRPGSPRHTDPHNPEEI
jgi:hypothetical protein